MRIRASMRLSRLARAVAGSIGACPTVALLALLAAVFAGCSLDYRSSELAEDRPESVPESIVTDATFTAVRSGGRTFTITAARAENYPEKSLRVFADVSFTEYDKDGEMLTEGTAGEARYYSDTDNVELSDEVQFYSTVHEAGISTEYLFWNDEQRHLEAKPDDLVTVERESGTVVRGRGFSADMARAIVTFERGVEGTLVTEDE